MLGIVSGCMSRRENLEVSSVAVEPPSVLAVSRDTGLQVTILPLLLPSYNFSPGFLPGLGEGLTTEPSQQSTDY